MRRVAQPQHQRSPVGRGTLSILGQIDYTGRVQPYSVDKIMAEARRLAAEYRRATGRPFAVGGEIAKHDAIRLLGLSPAPDDAQGYDAVRTCDAGDVIRYLIKNRAIFDDKTGQRLGQIKINNSWDRVLLVLLDEEFEAFEIHEATRDAIAVVSEGAQGGARAKRGSLSVARFKVVGRLVWSSTDGLILAEQITDSNALCP
ncbi:MAG: hypothetical protein ACI9W2_003933 [Gammaproteobacteria bacterium]|jgi:hypothetical protein